MRTFRNKAILASAVVALAVLAGQVQAGMFPNAGFEDGAGTIPDDWTVLSSPAQIVWNTTEAHSGSKCIEIEKE